MSQESELRSSDLVGGRYRLIELVGSGAMGSVWSAHNEMTERKFALKVMNQQAALDPSAVQRFLQEARAAGSLRHPAIVEVYDVGYHDSALAGVPALPYLVMELLEGETLEERLVKAGSLPHAEVLGFLHSIADGLVVAHAAGIVHRDLKPANLFFHGPQQVAKVLDFGISKLLGLGASDGVLTVAGLVLGSPPYMSPEQAGGKLDVDARTDVWALGVIAYRALSGRLPFTAPNYNALMLEIIHTQPEPIQELCPGIDSALAAIVMSCLDKDRERRPENSGVLAAQLSLLLDAGTGQTASAFSGGSGARSFRLHRFSLLAAVAALVAVGAGLAHLVPGSLARRSDSSVAVVSKASAPTHVPVVPDGLGAPGKRAGASEGPAGGADSVPRASASPEASVGPKTRSKYLPRAAQAPGPIKVRGVASVIGPRGGPPPVNEGVTSPGL